MKKISLTKGFETLVDDRDYEELNKYKWFYNTGYAARRDGYKQKSMHRQIMNTPEGMDTDHINRNKLDNRRSNLRICTRSENLMNRDFNQVHKRFKRKSTELRGVNKNYNKWVCQLKLPNHKPKHIGSFPNEHYAALAHDLWETYFYPKNSVTNFKVVSHTGLDKKLV